MRFAAIDFETANQRADSPCQLAVVVVDGGEICAEHCWLIRPKRLYFSPQCIAVHGILPEHVAQEKEWDTLWPAIHAALDGHVLVAHNAGFDLRVLRETMISYDLAIPDLEFTCTRLIARRSWPGRSGYGLKPIADSLGFRFKHHDALEDARVCARILLAAAKEVEATTLDELEQTMAILRGRLKFGALTGPKSVRRTKTKKFEGEYHETGPRRYRRDGWPEAIQSANQRLHVAESLVQASQQRPPLADKHVVLNGTLLGLERADAVLFLQRLGATVQPRINLQTDYVIVGQIERSSFQAVPKSDSPLVIEERDSEVQQRQEAGQPIRVLSQRQLLALVPGGLEAARSMS